jgi:hypothetical protein
MRLVMRLVMRLPSVTQVAVVRLRRGRQAQLASGRPPPLPY